MNEFISPHQNININISYNLGQAQDKIPKVVFGRKIPKTLKSRIRDADPLRKTDCAYAKPEDRKPATTKNQKPRKLQQNFFVSTEEIVNLRRLKTEGNSGQEAGPVGKKDPKSSSKLFSKSVWQNKSCSKQNTLTKSVPTKKTPKHPKKEAKSRNNSCILYPKKHVLSEVEHAVSLANDPKTHTRKRASSANVIRGDKFIDKLLNMSILTSEIGASIPLKEDSAKLSFRNRLKAGTLHDFMNSIDMRVVKSMQADKKTSDKKTILADLFIGEGLELITYLNKVRRIPMERLHEKAAVIQKFWRKKTSESILPYYRDLFRNAALGMQTMHTEDISRIDIQADSDPEDQSAPLASSSSRKRPNLCEGVDLLRKYRMDSEHDIEEEGEDEEGEGEGDEEGEGEGEIEGEGEDDEGEEDSQEDCSEFSNEERSLNIRKYQQLVRKTIEETKHTNHLSTHGHRRPKEDENELQSSEPCPSKDEVSSSHWNHVHNILSTNINQKAPLISNMVLEELMRQSAYNKKWIDGDFSSDSRKASRVVSPRGDSEAVFRKSGNEVPSPAAAYRDAPLEETEQEFNWNKYSDISDLKRPQAMGDIAHLPAGLAQSKEQMCLPYSNPIAYRQNSRSNSSLSDANQDSISNSNREDEDWVNSQIDQENAIVNNYLDCGLDNFGLKVKENLQKWEQEKEKIMNESDEESAMESGRQRPLRKDRKGNKTEEDAEILFSNKEDEEEEEEKVFVFTNEEHERRNSHRGDNHAHLSNRSLKKDSKVAVEFIKQQESAFERIFSGEHNLSNEEEIGEAVAKEINNRRVEKVTEDIIIGLLQEFAKDVSNILRNSQNNLLGQEQRSERNKPVAPINKTLGIVTNFQTIRDFISKLKSFILQNEEYATKVIKNLKNNIGPTSMEILSYLRIEGEEEEEEAEEKTDVGEDAEEWLFVVPNELFQKFNKQLIEAEEKVQNRSLSNRLKLYTEFWHRSIFECFNECLDFERPFGITGAPYAWITEAKMEKKTERGKIGEILENAENRLLQLSYHSSGIIFDKPDSPYRDLGLNEEAHAQFNEERISRMLANEILDDEYNWITYNDEMTELMVDISRKLEEMLIFQVATDLKKLTRKRKLLMPGEDSPEEDQQVVFQVDELE